LPRCVPPGRDGADRSRQRRRARTRRASRTAGNRPRRHPVTPTQEQGPTPDLSSERFWSGSRQSKLTNAGGSGSSAAYAGPMGRLVVTEFMALDGVMEAPGFEEHRDGKNTWALSTTTEDQQRFKVDELFAAGAILLGRVTYQIWATFWP